MNAAAAGASNAATRLGRRAGRPAAPPAPASIASAPSAKAVSAPATSSPGSGPRLPAPSASASSNAAAPSSTATTSHASSRSIARSLRRGSVGSMPLTGGTAGHIDHGKTWLVRALTGKDTDRLPEEQARGISIDLGYAPLELPDGRCVSVVDVPGHERFVRTMVAGATGIDLFLMVIDAAEGARPQTHEHLAILRLLWIEQGVVAVTKADAVDAETLELAVAEAGELVPNARVVAVSARTGAGLDELRAAL